MLFVNSGNLNLFTMNYTKTDLDDLTYEIIGSAITVHKELGPGLLESVYHRFLIEEFSFRNLRFKSELSVPIIYNNVELETQLRCDFLIENIITLELKSIEKLLPVHEAQLMTYMRLLSVPKGILLNFNCTNIFKEGQKTIVNELFRQLAD